MEKIIVEKSQPLVGTTFVSTSKNAILPIIAATLLTKEEVIISKTPKFTDVDALLKVIKSFGAQVRREKDKLIICCKEITNCEAPFTSTKSLRASCLVLGPMLAREGCIRLPMPGGCQIGVRPIDLHLKGLKMLGARGVILEGVVDARTKRLKGNRVYLDYPSVGATENIMSAAVLAQGTTVIENAATEPEIEDLACFLNKMGAKVSGAGSKSITIDGVKQLHGCEYTPIPDRIEAGTLMVAAVATGGDVLLENCKQEHLVPVIAKLEEVGAKVSTKGRDMRVNGGKKVKHFEITSSPYPGFPTDMQAQMTALACIGDGTSIITETVFENRFMHVGELIKMGADIKVDHRTAIIRSTKKFSGAKVCATDLRAGAALILAGLCAEGTTEIDNIHYIDRGYEHIELKLKSLGAPIKRINCYGEEYNE